MTGAHLQVSQGSHIVCRAWDWVHQRKEAYCCLEIWIAVATSMWPRYCCLQLARQCCKFITCSESQDNSYRRMLQFRLLQSDRMHLLTCQFSVATRALPGACLLVVSRLPYDPLSGLFHHKAETCQTTATILEHLHLPTKMLEDGGLHPLRKMTSL